MSNVSNAETPMYRAVDVNFAGELEKAFDPHKKGEMKLTNPKHMDLASEGRSSLVSDLSDGYGSRYFDLFTTFDFQNQNRAGYQNGLFGF